MDEVRVHEAHEAFAAKDIDFCPRGLCTACDSCFQCVRCASDVASDNSGDSAAAGSDAFVRAASIGEDPAAAAAAAAS